MPRSAAQPAGHPRVVVVGGGFAGFSCARQLTKRLARAGVPAAITLVSPRDYLLYTPVLPEVAGGLVHPRDAAVSLAQALPGVTYVPGVVTSVDLSGRTVEATQDHGDHPIRLGWDRLVLAPGSVTRLPRVPGLAEHAHGLKSVAEALYLRDHLLRQWELSARDEDEASRLARRTVVVVGASYGGTELILQLRAFADVAARHGLVPLAGLRFVLLDAAHSVMPEIGEALGRRALAALRSRGVTVELGVSLADVTGDHVVLDDGRKIRTRTVACVTGVEPNPLVAELGLATTKGRLRVGPTLQVEGWPDVFAIGDAAAVPAPGRPGEITPPTAQHAGRQGRTAGLNVAASLGAGSPRRYRHRDLGLLIDLGPGHALANPLGIPLSGTPAKLLTRGYHLSAIPSAANATGLAFSWITERYFERPVVQLGFVDDEGARYYDSERRNSA